MPFRRAAAVRRSQHATMRPFKGLTEAGHRQWNSCTACKASVYGKQLRVLLQHSVCRVEAVGRPLIRADAERHSVSGQGSPPGLRDARAY